MKGNTNMYRRSLFNDDSICIFTDASFKKNIDGNKDSSIGTVCSGACVYWNNILIDQNFYIMHNTTTQRGELYAILLGIMMAYKYRYNTYTGKYYNIRLFSDSQTSIFAIRDRIFRWVEDNRMGDNTEIKNQDIIMSIIDSIIYNNIPIELYHVKGHVNTSSYNDIKHAKEVFKTSNRIKEGVDDSLIYQISKGNDQVDEYTGFMLYRYLNSPGMKPAMIYSYREFDMDNYRKLIM